MNGGHTEEGEIKRGKGRAAGLKADRSVWAAHRRGRRGEKKRVEMNKEWLNLRRERTDLLVSFLFPRLDWQRLHFALKLVHLHVQRVYRVLKIEDKKNVKLKARPPRQKALFAGLQRFKNHWFQATKATPLRGSEFPELYDTTWLSYQGLWRKTAH